MVFQKFICNQNAAGIKVLTGLQTVEVRFQFVNKERRMIEIDGTEKTYQCDLCILAMGFVGPEKVSLVPFIFLLILCSIIISGRTRFLFIHRL